MHLKYYPFNLQLRHKFEVSGFSRNITPVVLVEIYYENYIGYGEASLPPYLGETQKSVIAFLKKVNLSSFSSPHQIEEILQYVDALAPENFAAKASVDIALHDLLGKIKGKALHQLWHLNADDVPFTSYTIGIDSPEIIREKTKEADNYKILKVKLGSSNDKELIKNIRSITNKPIRVDANQGWKDKYEALDMIHWLKEQNVEFVEQPMPKTQRDDMAWLTQNSPLPTIADEAVKRLKDIDAIRGVYTGINIKLMKSTGLLEAKKMIEKSRAYNLKIMMGCMTETSCAISAAAQLAPLVDWADLDGNLLIKNDAFEGVSIQNGKTILSNLPGIGVVKKK